MTESLWSTQCIECTAVHLGNLLFVLATNFACECSRPTCAFVAVEP